MNNSRSTKASNFYCVQQDINAVNKDNPMKNKATIDKMKEATFMAIQRGDLDVDDIVDFCNFTLGFYNVESVANAAKRLGISKQAVSKHKNVKIIGGKKYYLDNY